MVSFVETVKVLDGCFCDLRYHEDRLRATSRAFYGSPAFWDVSRMRVPGSLREGLVKCRVVYDAEVREITFERYVFRRVDRLVLVAGDGLEYGFKSTDRGVFSSLLEGRGAFDEVLIVQGGEVTDTSFSNVVLEDGTGFYTPVSFLLNGCRRRRLLEEGVVRERAVSVGDLGGYDRVFLINAMMGLEDGVSVEMKDVCLSGF